LILVKEPSGGFGMLLMDAFTQAISAQINLTPFFHPLHWKYRL
jgi:hypothetical protein